jgi:antirestriction protein ArdC
MPKKQSVYNEITNDIIALLESGELSWLKLWAMVDMISGQTGYHYRGINRMWLSLAMAKHKLNCPIWLTQKSLKDRGLNFKGIRSNGRVVIWKDVHNTKKKRQEFETAGVPYEEKWIPLSRAVWNAELFSDQINMDELYKEFDLDPSGFSPHEIPNDIEQIIAGMQATGLRVDFIQQNSAFYTPLFDSVTMPALNQFREITGLLSVLLHEIGHATGHPKRLDRKLFNKYGTKGYAKEELVAELISVYVLYRLGYDYDPLLENTTAYIQSWLKRLKEDKKHLFYAAKQAEDAANYLLEMVGV